MPPLHLLIKPSSGQCNLVCKYCFYCDVMENRQQKSYGFMSLKTLELVIQKALAYASGECTIAYQGGEPSLSGLAFFEKSIEFEKKHNVNHVKINHAFQTNGYALDEKWTDFFVRNQFLVGLSLDGTKDTNDCYRKNKAGGDTFNRLMKTVQLFNRTGVDYNILTVVHAQTAKRLSSIYRFYEKNEFRYLQFIPCLDPLGEEPGQRDYSLTPQVYSDFLKKLFDFWYRDLQAGKELHIRQFENYVEMLLGYPPESCGMAGICGIQNVVEADGSVYPCDFYVLDEYRLGDVFHNSFEELYQKREELRFVEESRAIDEACKDCGHFDLCRGGCKRHREPRGKDNSLRLNYFCESYQQFFDYAKPRLYELARSLARR